jgi:hypothetical protein
MRKTSFIALAAFALTTIISVQSCKKDKEPTTQEFVADNSSFASYMSWSLDKTFNGPDPLLGAMAHANNDSTVVRDVHFKNGQNPVSSKYPVGTLIVKHSHNPGGTVNEFTAMAKRGNNFNPNVGDWEFFMLTPTGAIATDTSGMPMRGANLMSGMCGSCHSMASAKDFVFSK